MPCGQFCPLDAKQSHLLSMMSLCWTFRKIVVPLSSKVDRSKRGLLVRLVKDTKKWRTNRWRYGARRRLFLRNVGRANRATLRHIPEALNSQATVQLSKQRKLSITRHSGMRGGTRNTRHGHGRRSRVIAHKPSVCPSYAHRIRRSAPIHQTADRAVLTSKQKMPPTHPFLTCTKENRNLTTGM